MKKIVIVGGSYGGVLVATDLDKNLKLNEANIILISPNDQFFNSVSSVRAVVDPGFASGQFLPFTKMFNNPNSKFVQGTVKKVAESKVLLQDDTEIEFDYLVFCTGAKYGLPFNLNGNSKSEAGSVFSQLSDAVQNAKKIVLVGGGPVGIETAAEIKFKYADKDITVVHSRPTILANDISDASKKRLLKKAQGMGIKFILGERVELPLRGIPYHIGQQRLKTDKGTILESDLTFICTGTGIYNSEPIRELSPALLDEKGQIKVRPTLQLDGKYDNIFSLGDVASTGSPKMVFYVNNQAPIVAKNIISLIRGKKLKEYAAEKDCAIMVSLGPKAGFGELFGLPSFMVDYMCKSMKSSSFFISNYISKLKTKPIA
jgi:NADH dehydrogenase FAD-containing subunit